MSQLGRSVIVVEGDRTRIRSHAQSTSLALALSRTRLGASQKHRIMVSAVVAYVTAAVAVLALDLA